MKLYMIFTLLVLSSLLTYKAQAINRKLMTKDASFSTTTTILKNQKNDEKKLDPKTEVKSSHHGLVGKTDSTPNSSHEGSKHWKKEIIPEQYPDAIDIAGMDYTPARKKSPIHN